MRQTLELLAQQGLSLSDRSLANLPLPDAVRLVLRQRILAFDATTLRALRIAAATGVEFDADLLADVLTLPLAAVLVALEPARRAGLITVDGAAPHRFQFDHALLRDALYDDLEIAERGTRRGGRSLFGEGSRRRSILYLPTACAGSRHRLPETLLPHHATGGRST